MPVSVEIGIICLSGESVIVLGIDSNHAGVGKTPYIRRSGFIVIFFRMGIFLRIEMPLRASE